MHDTRINAQIAPSVPRAIQFPKTRPELPPSHAETMLALARWEQNAERNPVKNTQSIFPTCAELSAEVEAFRRLLRAAFAA